jgi:hypothetical protein
MMLDEWVELKEQKERRLSIEEELPSIRKN